MKLPSLLKRVKHIKKRLKGMRLTVVLVVVIITLVGATSVVAYTLSSQKKKQPIAEKVRNKPATPAPKAELRSSAVVEGKPAVSDSTPPPSVSGEMQPGSGKTNKSAAKQAVKPRPHTSEDPAFVTCTQKYSELYVKYNADNTRINTEKNLALATIDELYSSGYYAEMYPGGTEPYNQWQIDRAELAAGYNTQLANLYSTYAANSSVYLNC